MSVQSSVVLETQNSPIWQNKDLGPNSTSIVFVNNSYNLVENLNQLIMRSSEIEQETNCAITIHGQWIKIKNSSLEARQAAFNLINAATDNSCNEIFLPSVNKESNEDTRLSSPSPPPSQNIPPTKSTKSTAQNDNSQAKPKRANPTLSNTPNYNQDVPNRKMGMVRSSTEATLSSLQSKMTADSPFSILLPSAAKNLKNTNILEEANETAHGVSTDLSNNVENKKRYSVDFLLLRSDVSTSKRLPPNWKELNEKYPMICFCGKVLSYFNPYKYYEHWEKTKNHNYELHNSNDSTRFAYYKKNNDYSKQKSHTDDYLNLQTAFNDFHIHPHSTNKFRHNEFQKPYNYNYESNGHKVHQLPFDSRQHQAYLQQENQMKRKPKYHFNVQKA